MTLVAPASLTDNEIIAAARDLGYRGCAGGWIRLETWILDTDGTSTYNHTHTVAQGWTAFCSRVRINYNIRKPWAVKIVDRIVHRRSQ